jgi:hypothetical protein
LKAGSFDAGGKTRVALLNPQAPIDPESPWPLLRLTPVRAQQIIDQHNWWHFTSRAA